MLQMSRIQKLVSKYGLDNADCQAELSPIRDLLITGTDVPAICGEGWDTWKDRFFQKCYRVKIPMNENMARGRRYEPDAIRAFQAATHATIYKVAFMRHAQHNWLGGTFDALAVMPDGREVVVEVKCPKQITPHSLPIQYVGQVQLYMDVADLETCMFVQYKPPGPRSAAKLDILEVKRDREYMQQRLPKLHNFYEELCYWRKTKEKLVEYAAQVLQSAWRLHKARKIVGGAEEQMARHAYQLKEARRELEERRKQVENVARPVLVIDEQMARMVSFAPAVCWVDVYCQAPLIIPRPQIAY
jgi:hypothetical protein